MQTSIVDLRSDTVTRPTEEMYRAMMSAPLGDDGLDGDPTGHELGEYAAHLLGKEAALYVPSCTMANLIAILVQTSRHDMVVAESTSHIYMAERGSATLTNTFYQGIEGKDGAMDIEALRETIYPLRSNMRVGVVCLETAHNNAGGTVLPLSHMQAVYSECKNAGIPVHLDGARLMNAAIALDKSVHDIASSADTVSICLSKGLSAPMGAVLAGSAQVIKQAKAVRKMLGGGQRQIGIAAAAGLVAMQSMVDRLAFDHQTATLLSAGINEISGLKANVPETNIVQIDVSKTGMGSKEWEGRLRRHGVLVRPWSRHVMRCVTHRHIGRDDIQAAISAFADVNSTPDDNR